MENFQRIESLRRALREDHIGRCPEPRFETQEEFADWECNVLKNLKAFDFGESQTFKFVAEQAAVGSFPLSAKSSLYLRMKMAIKRVIAEYEEKCLGEIPPLQLGSSGVRVTGDYSVFISYRRVASRYSSKLLSDMLSSRGVDVFLDVDALDGGRFEEKIVRQIKGRPNFIILIEQDTLARCSETDDWLRKEFECAEGCQRNIVPVLGETIRIEDVRSSLPDSMSSLPDYNVVHLIQQLMPASIDRLLTFLQPGKFLDLM